MSQELTKRENMEVGEVSEDVRQSRELSGQGSRTQIPFIPIITINNKSEKKKTVIDGEEVEVKVPIKKGFLMNVKNNNGEYEDRFLSGDISGVILKERYMIEKKWEEGEDQYRSEEFDDWNENITLYWNKSKKEKFTGTYQELKKYLPSTTKTIRGKEVQVKDYNLYVILYINLEDSDTVARLKLKMTADNKWFEYRNDFSDNETWANYLTHFVLEEKVTGDINYYYVTFQKGERVDLSKQLKLQIELNNLFDIIKKIRNNKGDNQLPFDRKPVEPAYEEAEEEKEDGEVKIEDIPF